MGNDVRSTRPREGTVRRIVPLLTAFFATALIAPPSAVAAPFITDGRPQLAAIAPGVTVTPLLTTGDVVGGRLGGFQFTGVPDGIGVYRSAYGRLEVFVNHELAYEWGDVADSRVDHLTLNREGKALSARYVLDGTEGYQWFCSSTMTMVDGVPWYLTGEEWIGSPKGGMSIAVNALTGRVLETPQFGAINHENVVPVDGLARQVVYLSEDSFQNRAQGYAYFADTMKAALRGKGIFTVFVPDDPGDGDPSANDLAVGETMSGRFVAIPRVERYNGRELNAVTEALTPFNFIRVEDAAPDPTNPGVLYLADSGSYRDIADTNRGRIYRFTFDPAHPRRATLEVVLDGDAGDRIMNPDNLGTSDTTLMIQEDHNRYATRAARVWAYDLASGTLTAIAKLDPTRGAVTRAGGLGVWESSGIVDVSDFFGEGAWLLDVQAHYTKVAQQGIDLRIGSARGEGGQLLLLNAPGT
jgi:hypothetical protein